MLKVEQTGLFEADVQEGLNLFLGAGFSTLAENEAKQKLPVGSQLKQDMIKEFERDDLQELDLQDIYTILSSDQKARVDNYLIRRFSVSKFENEYDNLRALDVRFVYTTNIDDLASKIFRPKEGEVRPVFHDVTMHGEPLDRRNSIQFIPLHGSVTHPVPDFRFSGTQLATAFSGDQKTWFVFQRELQARPTFFLGYAMRDAGVLQALSGAMAGEANRWILLRSEKAAEIELFEKLGFKVIIGETKDFLQYVATLSREKPSVAASGTIGRVPKPGEVAQRPVREFFLGAEPSWSDARSPNIVKRRVNARVQDLALQGKNVAIVGLPLSGKSTILKQVAAALEGRRDVLYFDRLNEITARQVIAEHSMATTKPIICIDQFIDSREGFAALESAGGFKFIVAESSIYFDSINPRRLPKNVVVVSCSEMDTADLQSILQAMPVDIRRRQIDQGAALAGIESVGLFESLMRNILNQDLRIRFKRKLAEFAQKDQQAFDTYLMSCYVNQCRTLVSYDMLHLFLSPKDYVEGYHVVDRIKEFLREAENDDPFQDHFTVRSFALSRIALGESSKEDFRRVFDTFFRRVTPKVIPDFPTFRRYAYDNDFAVKAYPDWKDGKVFYETLFNRDDNAYDYQHGAVYMSKLKQHQLAFEWIERALGKVGSRHFVIRNSHAIILFEANFEIYESDPDDKDAFEGIRQSMDVLENCIATDQWRRYHLLRYADQAMKVANVRRTTEVDGWLDFAISKLRAAAEDANKSGSRDVYNRAKYNRLASQAERVRLS